jgi:hypothetical protein
VALWFRILRQHGIWVSAGVMRSTCSPSAPKYFFKTLIF